MKNILQRLDQLNEGTMSKAEHNKTGPKFGGYWKGTQKSPPKPGQGVGGGCEESILKDLDKASKEPRRRDLMSEWEDFKLDEVFNSKQELINHFVKQGKSPASASAAWDSGYRGSQPKAKPTDMNKFQFKKPPVKSWQELDEYGGVGGYGAASQAPQGSTQTPDPKAQQEKLDQQQIVKNTNQLAMPLNQQGAAQNLNKVKFSDTMTKLDDKPNTDLNAQELKQMEPLAVATSKALQNPQTANQMKQLITKSDTLNKQKDQKVQQAQQQVGTNQPANQQNTNAPGQQQNPQGQQK
jgi:hypothetical protein